MFSIEHAKPTAKQLLHHVEVFEDFCLGNKSFSPSKFREINQELSIGAVLLIGKRRYIHSAQGQKNLYWRGLDNREHNLGPVSDANIMRDYPGFHAKRSLSLAHDMIADSKVEKAPNKKGNITVVTMKDGTIGVGPDFRMALRNAAIKMHLTSKFNYFSFGDLWGRVWGHA